MGSPPRTIAVVSFSYDASGNLTLHVHGGEDVRIEAADVPLVRTALAADPEMRRSRRP